MVGEGGAVVVAHPGIEQVAEDVESIGRAFPSVQLAQEEFGELGAVLGEMEIGDKNGLVHGLGEDFGIAFGGKADVDAALVFEYGAFDHRGLCLHQGDGAFAAVGGSLLGRAEFAPGGAFAVDENVCANGIEPAGEPFGRGGFGFEINEGVGHLFFVQLGASFFHGGAVGDAVEGGHYCV